MSMNLGSCEKNSMNLPAASSVSDNCFAAGIFEAASVQEGHSPEIVGRTDGIARATMYGLQGTVTAAWELWMHRNGVAAA
jgi:hypothetical protein